MIYLNCRVSDKNCILRASSKIIDHEGRQTRGYGAGDVVDAKTVSTGGACIIEVFSAPAVPCSAANCFSLA